MSWNGVHEVPISECCTLINGRVFKPEEWSDEGLPIVRIQNLRDPLKPFKHYDGEVDERHLIDSGALLFSWSGNPDTSFGAHFWWRGRAILNQHIFRVIVDPERVDARYLCYALNHRLSEVIARARGGAGVKHIKRGQLEAVTLPLPQLPEQRRLATVLDRAHALKIKRRRALELCDKLIRAIYLEMFGDPLSQTSLWTARPLGELVKIQLGKMVSPEAKRGDRPVPYLGNAQVRWRRFELSDIPQMDFTDAELHKYELSEGDLLLCEGGEVGRCAIWRGARSPIAFQKALYRVRCDATLLCAEYLQETLMLIATRGGLEHVTRTATIGHLSSTELRALPIPLPPCTLQEEFRRLYLKYEQLRVRLNHAADHQLSESLIQRAFRGEL